MNTTSSLALGLCILTGVTWAGAVDIIQPQKGRITGAGVYVPVHLDEDARDQMEAGLPAQDVTVRAVPFDLVEKTGANHLFLKSAEWPDWKADPSSYYAA